MKLEFNIVPAHVLQTYVQTLYKNISRKPLENVDVGDNFTLGRNSTLTSYMIHCIVWPIREKKFEDESEIIKNVVFID